MRLAVHLMLLAFVDGIKIFYDFLRCEYSEENILFYLACEVLKSEKDCKLIEIKARDIYQAYITIMSDQEVSIQLVSLWAHELTTILI